MYILMSTTERIINLPENITINVRSKVSVPDVYYIKHKHILHKFVNLNMLSLYAVVDGVDTYNDVVDTKDTVLHVWKGQLGGQYYTKSETENKIREEIDERLNSVDYNNNRYYTKTEIDTMLASPPAHTHNASQIDVDTTDFVNVLNGTTASVQLALNKLDKILEFDNEHQHLKVNINVNAA